MSYVTQIGGNEVNDKQLRDFLLSKGDFDNQKTGFVDIDEKIKNIRLSLLILGRALYALYYTFENSKERFGGKVTGDGEDKLGVEIDFDSDDNAGIAIDGVDVLKDEFDKVTHNSGIFAYAGDDLENLLLQLLFDINNDKERNGKKEVSDKEIHVAKTQERIKKNLLYYIDKARMKKYYGIRDSNWQEDVLQYFSDNNEMNDNFTISTKRACPQTFENKNIF